MVGLSAAPFEGLFSAILARGDVALEVSDIAWLRAMLDVEGALARAGASAGLFPPEAARAITVACADTCRYDAVELGREAAAAANPVVPLVRAIEEAAGDFGAYVHQGATSQDILDTAMVLVARRAIRPLRADLDAASQAAARHGTCQGF